MIATVIVWTNGNVMVLDEKGEQLPDYQGRWEEKQTRIERDKPADAVVQYGVWNLLDRAWENR